MSGTACCFLRMYASCLRLHMIMCCVINRRPINLQVVVGGGHKSAVSYTKYTSYTYNAYKGFYASCCATMCYSIGGKTATTTGDKKSSTLMVNAVRRKLSVCCVIVCCLSLFLPFAAVDVKVLTTLNWCYVVTAVANGVTHRSST